MEIATSFVADTEPFELVQPGEGVLDHPAGLAHSWAVGGAASGGSARARTSSTAPEGLGTRPFSIRV